MPYQNLNGISSLEPSARSLRTFDVLIPSNSPHLLDRVGQLVLSCPQLQRLSIHAAGRLWPDHVLPRRLQDRTMAQFNTMSASSWLSQHTNPPNLPLKLTSLELHNFCVCDCNWQDWEGLFDWSRLICVKFTCFSFLRNLQGKLPKLRCLDLHLDTDRDCEYDCCKRYHSVPQIREFLLSCSGLVELGLTNGTDIVNKNLLVHLGGSLRRLSLHEYAMSEWMLRGDCDRPQRPLLSKEQLEQIGCHCPLVRDLAVDVPYADSDVSSVFLQL